MIEHAWTVVCDKQIIDRDSNNVSLDAVEQLGIPDLQIPDGGAVLVPYSLWVVSLWYRRDPSVGERATGRIVLEAPDRRDVGRFDVDVNLENHERARTRAQMQGFPVAAFGRYFFRVELQHEGEWQTVARIPYTVVQVEPPPQAALPAAG